MHAINMNIHKKKNNSVETHVKIMNVINLNQLPSCKSDHINDDFVYVLLYDIVQVTNKELLTVLYYYE